MKKAHIPAPGKAAGLAGIALCGKWAHYKTGDHGLIRSLAIKDLNRDGDGSHWCSRCLKNAQGQSEGSPGRAYVPAHQAGPKKGGEKMVLNGDFTITTTPLTGVFAGKECFTNRRGEGLFTRRSDGTYLQHCGTLDFAAKTPAELLRKIHRIFDCK